jgi:hypothetical protein
MTTMKNFLKVCLILGVHKAFQKAAGKAPVVIGAIKGELPEGSQRILGLVSK